MLVSAWVLGSGLELDYRQMQIFQYVDNLFLAIPPAYRSATALFVLLLLVFSLWRIIKGYGIFILIIIILIPGIWPALKTVGGDLLLLLTYILYRI